MNLGRFRTAFAFGCVAAALLALALWGAGMLYGPGALAAALTCSAALLCLLPPSPAPRPPSLAPRPFLEAALLAALLYVAFLAVPLPAPLSRLAGRERVDQNLDAAACIAEARGAGYAAPANPHFALTRNRAGTLRFLELLAAACGTLLAVAALPPPWKQAFLRFAVLLGAALAAAGFVGQWIVPQRDTLLWTIPIAAVRPGPVACFVNRNHFGGFLALLVPVALTLTLDDLAARRRLAAAAMALCAAAMGLAAVFSLSRGALLVLGFGLAALCLFLLRRGWPRAGLALAVAGALGAAAVLAVPAPAVRDRLRTLADPLATASAHTRLANWREALRAAPHYPVLGAGPNALRMVFPQVRRTSHGSWLIHAENEYVEYLAEGGAAGLLLGAALLLALRRRELDGRAVLPRDATRAAGVPAAAAVVAAHALLDFPLTIPLYALVFAGLMGTVLVQPPLAADWWRARGRPRLAALLRLSPAALGLAATAWLAAALHGSHYRLDAHEHLQRAGPATQLLALQWAPTSWHAWYYFGRIAAGDGQHAGLPALARLGERCVTRAAACDPQNYRIWYNLGLLRRAQGDGPGATQAFEQARRLRPWLTPPSDVPSPRPSSSAPLPP